MIVQTQPTGIHDGLQFTLEHKDISELEKAEGLLFMLLIKVCFDEKALSSFPKPRREKSSYFMYVHMGKQLSPFYCFQIKTEFEDFMNSLNAPQGN